jgi:hypothetical protein
MLNHIPRISDIIKVLLVYKIIKTHARNKTPINSLTRNAP